MTDNHGSRGWREVEMSKSALGKAFSSNAADSHQADEPTDLNCTALNYSTASIYPTCSVLYLAQYAICKYDI